jgi:phenylalanyl-tRNA synthetase alpha chain
VDWDKEWIDVTAPGERLPTGHLHPITLLENEIADIFASLGFGVWDGPELEIEQNNFDSLNFPQDHPARDMQDTFWVKQDKHWKHTYLPRTHTSTVQVRYMQEHKPPIRIIVPGRIFRNEATDASHEHTFHQFECLMVDEPGKVTVATFKYIAETFFSRFFGKKIDIRLRPSYFPFTEPSFEFDISCVLCERKGCSVCQQTGWLEIGGAGMVNQKVFESVGIQARCISGFCVGIWFDSVGYDEIQDYRYSTVYEWRPSIPETILSMKYSYHWLKELSGTKKPADRVADLLMRHAFEVETVESYAHHHLENIRDG